MINIPYMDDVQWGFFLLPLGTFPTLNVVGFPYSNEGCLDPRPSEKGARQPRVDLSSSIRGTLFHLIHEWISCDLFKICFICVIFFTCFLSPDRFRSFLHFSSQHSIVWAYNIWKAKSLKNTNLHFKADLQLYKQQDFLSPLFTIRIAANDGQDLIPW